MKKIIIIAGLLCGIIIPQSSGDKKGVVTFLSSQNVYVRFDNVSDINAGDTLFVKKDESTFPVIIVKYLSSTSVAGEKINEVNLNTGDEVFARINIAPVETAAIIDEPEVKLMTQISPAIKDNDKNITERIDGKFSVQSYSNFSNFPKGDFQRWRYVVSFDGRNLGELPVSLQTYINFNYKTDEWSFIKEKPLNNVRVYDMAVTYQFSENSTVVAGRHINEKITNISSIDGIQYHHKTGIFGIGAFAGSRPDFNNMGFNLKLFQAGVYFNRSDTVNDKIIDNTIAFVEQTNNFKTDRRLIYFQHSNNLLESLSFFVSAEADLYKKVNNESKNELSLTGLFVSARYSPFSFASLNLSYDARRNVIYYETFKNIIETLLDNEMRQGLRGNINIRPFANLFAGVNAGYRFRKGDPAPSNDLGAYLSYNSVPLLTISPSLSFTRIKSAFISGNIYGIMVSKSIDLLNSNISMGYRNSDYTFSKTISSVQNSVSANFSVSILRKIYLNIGWEGLFEKKKSSGRLIADISSRL